MWYLFRLIEYTVFAPLIFLIITHSKLSVVLGGIVLLNLINNTSYFSIIYFLPVYCAGAYMGYHYSDFIENNDCERKWNAVKWLVILISIVLLCFVGNDRIKMLVRYLCIIPIVFLFRKQRIHKSSPIIKMGMFLYCSHELVFRVCRNVITVMHLNMFSNWICLIIMSASVILIIWNIMRHCAPKILNILTGNRC